MSRGRPAALGQTRGGCSSAKGTGAAGCCSKAPPTQEGLRKEQATSTLLAEFNRSTQNAVEKGSAAVLAAKSTTSSLGS